MSKEIQKIENNSSEAPLPTPKEGETEELKSNIFTICPDCCSPIEILSINENNSSIDYKCLNEKNNHADKAKLTISISAYLEKIKKLKENKIDELKDKCHIENHNLNKYVSYCLDCKCHLCDECLKTREHINHRKSNMIEIQPREEEIKLIKEVINDYRNEKKNLEKIKKEQTEEIDKSLEKAKKEEEDNYKKQAKESEDEKVKDLQNIENKYLSDLEDIKKEYDEKVKLRKNKYLEDKEKLITEYKLKDEKFISEKNLNIKKIEENYKKAIKNLEFEIKIENNDNMLELNEIIYNTYDNYSNNYYNSMSINNLLLYYNNNTDINDKMRNILGNRYDEIINIRKTKFNEDIQIKLEDELNKAKKDNKKLEDELNQAKKDNQKLEDALNNIKKENKKELEDKENKMNELNKKYKDLKEMNKKLNDIIKENDTKIKKLELDIKDFEKIKKENERLNKEYNEIKEKLNNAPQQNVILLYNIFSNIECKYNYFKILIIANKFFLFNIIINCKLK